MAESQPCSLNRTWVLKTGIFMLVLIGFGCWALFDAAVLYPRRGLAEASYRLREYLSAADKAGLLRSDRISSANQHADLSALSSKIEDLRSAARRDGQEAKAAAMDAARYEWLTALQRSWKLDSGPEPLGELSPPKHSLWFDAPRGEGYATDDLGNKNGRSAQALLDELNALWGNSNPPSALSAYDLPVQWLFVVIGFGLGGYLVILLARCAAKAGRFRFDPDEQRLTLPGGASFVPADLEDIDKRQWHKYYVTIITKDGVHHRLDLLRYVPLEDWVLAMEKTRFPERAAEDAPPADEPPAGNEEPAIPTKSEEA